MSPLSASLLWATLCCLEWTSHHPTGILFLPVGRCLESREVVNIDWKILCVLAFPTLRPPGTGFTRSSRVKTMSVHLKIPLKISPLEAQPSFSDACKPPFIEQVCYKSSPCVWCASILASQDCRQQAWSWIQGFWHRREDLSGCCTQPNKPYINYFLSCSNRKRNNRAIGQVKYSHMPQNSPWYILNTRNSRYIAAVRVTCW